MVLSFLNTNTLGDYSFDTFYVLSWRSSWNAKLFPIKLWPILMWWLFRLLWTVTTIDLFTTILSGLLRSCTIQQWITLDGIGYYADLLDMIFTRRAAGFWSNFVLLISPLCCAPEPHVTQHAHDTICFKRSVRERARKRRKWASSLPVYNLCSYFISP